MPQLFANQVPPYATRKCYRHATYHVAFSHFIIARVTCVLRFTNQNHHTAQSKKGRIENCTIATVHTQERGSDWRVIL